MRKAPRPLASDEARKTRSLELLFRLCHFLPGSKHLLRNLFFRIDPANLGGGEGTTVPGKRTGKERDRKVLTRTTSRTTASPHAIPDQFDFMRSARFLDTRILTCASAARVRGVERCAPRLPDGTRLTGIKPAFAVAPRIQIRASQMGVRGSPMIHQDRALPRDVADVRCKWGVST